VAATRVAYLETVSLNKKRSNRTHRFKTGRRDNQMAVTQGPTMVEGQVKLPAHPNEWLEWLAITFGDGAITTPGGGTLSRTHTYKPTASLTSMTLERNDGSRVYRGLGIRGAGLSIDGSVDGDNSGTFDLYGNDVDTAFTTLTAALPARNPPFLEGWQCKFFLDALGGTPGTTQISDLLADWSIKLNNNMTRIYAAGNTQAAIGTVPGELDLSSDLTFLAESTAAATELTNWNAGTPKLLRLEFIGPVAIEAAIFPTIRIDIPGYWGDVDRNKEAFGAVRAYGFPLDYVYDSTLASGIVIACTCNRLTAF
jgi:hypothetical protein